MIEWLGPIIFEYYGATESYGFTRCTSEEWLGHKGTVGRAVTGQIVILDDDGAPVPVGTVGNVWFRSDSQFRYFGAEDTESSDGSKAALATVGDVGRVDADGFLYLTDRKSFMIVSGGVNIYPQEVEDVLLADHAVDDVAVIGVPNEVFGEEVKAVVVTVPDVVAGPELETELIGYCRSRMAAFKCPRSVDFVGSLPRLETGKLAKHLVRAGFWSGHSSTIV